MLDKVGNVLAYHERTLGVNQRSNPYKTKYQSNLTKWFQRCYGKTMVWDDVGRTSMIIAHMIHWVNFAKYTVRLSDILLFGT
jgi:hypothetical protein